MPASPPAFARGSAPASLDEQPVEKRRLARLASTDSPGDVKPAGGGRASPSNVERPTYVGRPTSNGRSERRTAYSPTPLLPYSACPVDRYARRNSVVRRASGWSSAAAAAAPSASNFHRQHPVTSRAGCHWPPALRAVPSSPSLVRRVMKADPASDAAAAGSATRTNIQPAADVQATAEEHWRDASGTQRRPLIASGYGR